jgi:hypothetical protein
MNTNKLRLVAAGLFSLLALSPTITSADEPYTLTLINHYDQPLTFSGRQNATEVLPELPADFTLRPTEQITSKVVDLQKHAYMKVVADSKHNAFFGVEVVDSKVKVHGYIGKGIAYSWTTNVVTFCTPDEYAKANKCL